MDEQNLETQNTENDTEGGQPKQNSNDERKINPVVWIILMVGAAILDTFQVGISALTFATLGTIINILIDIFVGLSLALFFALKGILDFKLGLSLILGFAAEFFTGGIAPAWLLDILYAFMVTDGARFAGMMPVVGEAAREAALTVMSKGKSVEKQASLRARTDELKKQDRAYMANNKSFNKNKKKEDMPPEDESGGQIESGDDKYNI